MAPRQSVQQVSAVLGSCGCVVRVHAPVPRQRAVGLSLVWCEIRRLCWERVMCERKSKKDAPAAVVTRAACVSQALTADVSRQALAGWGRPACLFASTFFPSFDHCGSLLKFPAGNSLESLSFLQETHSKVYLQKDTLEFSTADFCVLQLS